MEDALLAKDKWALALAFDAPFLIEKLLKDHVITSADEGQALFLEVKRYLVLVADDPSVAWSMYSLRIDHIWHQFILFTHQYIDFCRQNFGKYVQHAPSTSPSPKGGRRLLPSTFQMFADRYEDLFGEPLSELWHDEQSVTLDRRIINSRAGSLSLLEDGDMVELINGKGDEVFAIDQIARPALEFIIKTGTFFVRELPGAIDDNQRVILVSTLVENKLLDIA